MQGEILIDGTQKQFDSPKEAEKFGLSFIHQEMNTWPEMTVVENLFLGNEIKNAIGFNDNKKMRALATETFRELGVSLNLDEEVKNLSVGQE